MIKIKETNKCEYYHCSFLQLCESPVRLYVEQGWTERRNQGVSLKRALYCDDGVGNKVSSARFYSKQYSRVSAESVSLKCFTVLNGLYNFKRFTVRVLLLLPPRHNWPTEWQNNKYIPRNLVVNHNYHEVRSISWIEINQLQPTYVTFLTHWKKPMFPKKSVRVLTEAKTVNVDHIFDLRSRFIVPWDNGSEEIAGWWQNNSLCETNVSCVLYVRFRVEEHSLVKLFAILKNFCYQYFYFVPFFVLFCVFCELLIGPQPAFLECIFFPCDGIDKLCLGGPGCSSHTIRRPRSAWMLDGIPFGDSIR